MAFSTYRQLASKRPALETCFRKGHRSAWLASSVATVPRCRHGLSTDAGSNDKLPGRLGDPNMTLATDPRLHKGLLDKLKPKLVGGYGLIGKPAPGLPASLTSLRVVHWWCNLMEKHIIPACMIHAPERDFSTVEEFERVITGVDGNSITLHVCKPKVMSGPVPVVYYIHGGGMMLMSAMTPIYRHHRRVMASKGFVEVGVEFRNSSGVLGNHPYPAGLNDCLSGLQWTFDNLSELGGSKIVVAGESGGGNLALACAIRAKKEGRLGLFSGVHAYCPFIAGPRLWGAGDLQSLRECDRYFLASDQFHFCTMAYDPEGKHEEDPCAWPLAATKADLVGLPPTMISVNELDPLRDEGLLMASKFEEAGVRTSTRVTKGLFHAADVVEVEGCEEIFNEAIDNFIGWINALDGE